MAAGRFELNQLRCFVAVAEELNFRRAAERLNMTQPPLSRQIKLLEHGIGLLLFDRSNRTVRLTPAGDSLLVSATDLLQRAEHAVLTARQAARGEAGSIALGFVPSAGLSFVPRIVAAVRRDLPEVTFNPTEMMSYEIVAALRSGQLDLGLTRTSRSHREIESVRVVSESFVLAVPGNHPLATVEAPVLGDLDGADYVGFSSDRGGYLNSTLSALFATVDVVPRVVVEVSQTHSVVSLVNRGIGVALVPASAQAMRMDNLAYRDIELPARFRSTLYLTIGPKKRGELYARVRDTIVEALAEFRADGA